MLSTVGNKNVQCKGYSMLRYFNRRCSIYFIDEEHIYTSLFLISVNVGDGFTGRKVTEFRTITTNEPYDCSDY